MKVRAMTVDQAGLDYAVPEGYGVLSVTGDTEHGVVVLLEKLEPAPNLAQLIQAATEAPAGTAVGIPSDMLREAMREIGYAVPEPSPIQPASMADVHEMERPKRPIKDSPQA